MLLKHFECSHGLSELVSPINVCLLLSRFSNWKRINEEINWLFGDGTLIIVIGTHSFHQIKLNLESLGLVFITLIEEHAVWL